MFNFCSDETGLKGSVVNRICHSIHGVIWGGEGDCELHVEYFQQANLLIANKMLHLVQANLLFLISNNCLITGC